jgi:hypothetical protein
MELIAGAKHGQSLVLEIELETHNKLVEVKLTNLLKLISLLIT